jgi:hypothetical protein
MALAPFSIRVDVSAVQRALREIASDDAPFLLAYALTKTGQDIKAAEYRKMQEVFDRPTRYALNSLQLTPATKQSPTATVDYRYFGGTPAERYLGPNVEGGERSHKAHEKRLIRAGLMKDGEYAVPGQGVKLDAYGNIPGSTIERILSQLGASEQMAGYQANETARSRKRNRKKNTGRYFVLRPDASNPRLRRDVQPGIYWRKDARTMVPVIMFVGKPQYQKIFPFYETARAVFDRTFAMHARAGFERYVSKRRKAA